MNELEDKLITSKIKTLVKETSDLPLIVRYFIIDACLSEKFVITLEEAKTAWLNEVNEINKIHEKIKTLNIPRVFQCAQFALFTLLHLFLRGLNRPTCTYTTFEARNFIVALVITNQCVCSSYNLYVQAMAQHFKYDDCIDSCLIPGHVFTIIPTSKEYLIGVDTGFFNNDVIHVRFNSNYSNYSNSIKLNELKELLGLTKDDVYFQFYPFNSQITCEKENKEIIHQLLNETASFSFSFNKSMRNMFLLSYITNYKFIKEKIKYDLEFIAYTENLFNSKLSIVNDNHLQQMKTYLRSDTFTNWNEIRTPTFFNLSFSIYMFFSKMWGEKSVRTFRNAGLQLQFLYDLYNEILKVIEPYKDQVKFITEQRKPLQCTLQMRNKIKRLCDIKSENVYEIQEVTFQNYTNILPIYVGSTIYYNSRYFTPTEEAKSGLVYLKHYNHMPSFLLIAFAYKDIESQSIPLKMEEVMQPVIHDLF